MLCIAQRLLWHQRILRNPIQRSGRVFVLRPRAAIKMSNSVRADLMSFAEGDGYTNYTEVVNGYNPNETGRW